MGKYNVTANVKTNLSMQREVVVSQSHCNQNLNKLRNCLKLEGTAISEDIKRARYK